ncbi:hypothetical protein ILUMI_15596, partial [Ignelater luminosus]
MNCNKFYGGRIVRYKFMCDALNHLEAFTLEKEHDVVLLPPASGNKRIESDEDIDDEALHRSNLPQEVPGEIEINQIDSGKDEDECSNGKKLGKTKTLWKKSESLALQASIAEPPKVRSEHAGKSEYEIFLLFRTLEIISYITEQTNLYAKMFIKNKPVRFAFKIWMLCGSDRYPYNMDIYC